MHKILLLLVLISCLIFCGCDGQAPSSTAGQNDSSQTAEPVSELPEQDNVSKAAGSSGSDLVEIKEKMFIQGCNDVYLNPENYADKRIKIEGMFESYRDDQTGKEYFSVIRNGPGCCGNDGVAGFNFAYGDTSGLKQNDWIEVIGKVKQTEDSSGIKWVFLDAISVQVSKKRGAEFVEN